MLVALLELVIRYMKWESESTPTLQKIAGIVRSRAESFGIVRSHLKSFGGIIRIRSWSHFELESSGGIGTTSTVQSSDVLFVAHLWLRSNSGYC